MPEVRDDPRQRWLYEFDGPTVDLQRDRSKVRMPNLVESVGTDGRFLGAIRPFPGFADDSVHGVESPGVSGVKLAKFVTVQKGLSDHVLRGIVFVANNTALHTINPVSASGTPASSTDYVWQSIGSDVYVLQRNTRSGANADTTNLAPKFHQPTHVSVDGSNLTFREAGTLSAGEWSWRTDSTVGGEYTIHVKLSGEVDPNKRLMKFEKSADAVYFSYYDSEEEDSGLVTLDDFALTGHLDDTVFTDYDVCSNGRYIYFVGRGASMEPVNRAYWWDFAYTEWQVANEQFESRHAGVFYGDNQYDAGDDTTDRIINIQRRPDNTINPDPTLGGIGLPVYYRFGVELVSRKHNLRSRFAFSAKQLFQAGDSAQYVELDTDNLRAPFKWNSDGQRVWDGSYLDQCSNHWGLQTWDGLRTYRSVGDATNISPTLDLTGEIFFEGFGANSVRHEEEDRPKYLADIILDTTLVEQDDFPAAGTDSVVQMGGLSGIELTDNALARTNFSYNPFLDAVGPMPSSTRISPLGNGLLVVAHPTAKADPEKDWHYEGSLPQTLRYSSFVKNEPENFPTSNVYRSDEAGEVFLSLEPTGDYVFACGRAGQYRVLRSGSQVAIIRLHDKVCGVSRWGQTGIGNSLFILTTSGFKEIDGNSGAIRSMSALDRMVFDEREWGSTLSSVHVEYDSVMGCLVLLNTATDEAVLLWEATGAITTLEGCPWDFLTSGPDAVSGEARRVYFVMSDGRVHTIDVNREMARVTMFGLTQADIDAQNSPGVTFTDCNLFVQSGTSTTLTLDVPIAGSGPVWPNDSEGFRFYFLTGPLKGQFGTITSVDGSNVATVSGLDCTSAVEGNMVSIGPVVFRVTCPQLDDSPGRYDLFTRKKAKAMSVSLTNMDPGVLEGLIPEFNVGCFKRLTKTEGGTFTGNEIQDQTVTKMGSNSITGAQLYPYIECLHADVDFELQALLVRGDVTGTEAETRQQ